MLIINGANIWMPALIGGIVDGGIRSPDVTALVRGTLVLLAIALAKGVATYLQGMWTETASQSVAYDVRNQLHEKLQELSFSFHDGSETGQLLARSVQDVERVRFLSGRAVLNLFQTGVQILGVAAAMLIMETRLALVILVIMPVLVASAVRFGIRVRPLSMQIRDREARLTTRLEQNLRGARIVAAFAREPAEMRAFDSVNRELLETQRSDARIRAIYLPFMQLLAGVGTLIVIIFGGRLVLDGAMTLGRLVAFLTYLAQLLRPVRRFGMVIGALAQASASAERIFEVLDRRLDIQDAPGAIDLERTNGEIAFRNVTLSYAGGRRALEDVSFSVAPGERLALLGGSGSGKSSIIRLVPRFYDPSEGQITLDGTDIRDITLKSLRNQIGTVSQDTVLFASTIGENIAFSRPGSTQQEIESAARAARIDHFIATLPRGYDTYVGENGVSLSGGQRQRISIARAILKDPKILILDDATSSVDTETEQQIHAALQTLIRGRTSIIIAHRLSSVRTADEVIVMDRGRIESRARRSGSQSPHDQLLRSSRLYAEIFARQLRDDIAEGAAEERS